MFKKVLVSVAMMALAALPALAKPNFSGDWKLNTTKSTFGDIPGPDSMSYKVTHDDPKFTSHSKQSGQMGEIEMSTTCTTDSKECTSEGFQGSPIKNVMKWDGDVLVVTGKRAVWRYGLHLHPEMEPFGGRQNHDHRAKH